MRWKFLIAGVVAALLLSLALCLVSHNLRLSGVSRQDFSARLDSARDRARDWVLVKDMADPAIHRERLRELLENPALLYMLADCDQLAGEHAYSSLLRAFLQNLPPGNPWARMVDPDQPFADPDQRTLERLLDYQRWFLWAIAPDRVTLPAAEKADLDSMDRMQRGRLTHQIFAWHLYRRLHGSTPQIDQLIRHLCERAAGEATVDFRVTDQYLQRLAFILHAGHPDLIRPRWVERALASQQEDGGWTWAWNGWGPRAFQLRMPEERSSAHPTAQGLWITYLLKYRYPQWIHGHYH